MLGILRHFIFSTLFALFASHASAMFIQADNLDPTVPGVGTNRYGYSHGDPINNLDPSGHATVFSDSDGDGMNETATHFAPDSPIGRDLANGQWGSYRGWKSEFGTVRDAFSSLIDGQYASWTGKGLSGNLSYENYGRLAFGQTMEGAPQDPFHDAVAMSALLAGFATTMASHYPDARSRNNRTVAVLAAAGYYNSINIVVALSGKPGTSASYMTQGQKGIVNDITGRAVSMGVFGSIHNASQQHRYGTHAETKALGFAQAREFSPIALGASRPFCPGCSASITTSGGTIVGPQIAIWP